MDIYNLTDTILLSFSQIRSNAKVTGLTVTVTVTNAKTNAVLLASTNAPEISTGAGVYTYNWSHGLKFDTECLITYTAGALNYFEYIFVSTDLTGGRSN